MCVLRLRSQEGDRNATVGFAYRFAMKYRQLSETELTFVVDSKTQLLGRLQS